MEIKNLLIIIYIIVDSIQYRNKELVFNFIIALILTKGGFVTEVIIERITDYHFTTVYKFIERNNWNYILVHQKILVTLVRMFNIKVIRLVIDDTFLYRSRKKKILKGQYFYDHSHKPNRSKFIWGQTLLMCAAVVNIHGTELALPVLAHILNYDKGHSSNRIILAVKMIQLARNFLLDNKISPKMTILADSFFAKKNLFSEDDSTTDILQVRRDADLRDYPPLPETRRHIRGPKPHYGKRIITGDDDLKYSIKMHLYGKEHIIHYTYFRAKAKFLKGREVLALFIRFDQFDKVHLIISTDLCMGPIDVLYEYERRNSIEPMFNELKNQFGLNKLYFQSSVPYKKMLYMKLWTYILIKITSTLKKRTVRDFTECHLPWRIKPKHIIPVTAGITQLVIKEYFGLLDYNTFLSKVLEIQTNSTTIIT